jgi:hypothetical protein
MPAETKHGACGVAGETGRLHWSTRAGAKLRGIAVAVLAACVITVRAADYWVDGRAQDAGDGGSARPFQTIQAAAFRAGPGDTVHVRAGIYDQHSATIAFTCDVERPAWALGLAIPETATAVTPRGAPEVKCDFFGEPASGSRIVGPFAGARVGLHRIILSPPGDALEAVAAATLLPSFSTR